MSTAKGRRLFVLVGTFVAGCLVVLWYTNRQDAYSGDKGTSQVGGTGMDARKMLKLSKTSGKVKPFAVNKPELPTGERPRVSAANNLQSLNDANSGDKGTSQVGGTGMDGRKMLKLSKTSGKVKAVAGNKPGLPTGERPRVPAAHNFQSLTKGNFTQTWTEDRNLQNLRRYGATENIPDDKTLASYDTNKLSALYHSFLDNEDIRCRMKLRMGQVGNCGWEVCDDYEWRPIRPCIIYSFGINYEFSFDDDAAKIYGCKVYAFDPSMSKQPTYQRNEGVMFYRLGIGGKSGGPQKAKKGWTLYSLSSFKAMLGHSDEVIDVLKMDVESAEWTSLDRALKERQLANVRQLLVEYHTTKDDPGQLRSRLKILRGIERAGFKKFYITKNPACHRKAVGIPIQRTKCYEVHYVNSKFMRKSE